MTGSTGLLQQDSHGKVVPAKDRDEYFPIRFIEPLQQNEVAMGFDLASSEPRRKAMWRARDTGKPSATSLIELVQGRDGRPGFVVYLASYNGTHSTLAERREHLTGFSSAVFRVDTLLEATVKETDGEGLDLRVTDDATGEDLYASSRVITSETLPRCVQSLDIAARRWTLMFVPRAEFLALHRSKNEWIVLGVGLIFSLLLAAYLYGGLRRTIYIERRVVERTKQLSAEVTERRRAEHAARLAESKYRSIFENSVEGIFQTSPDGRYLSANRALAQIYGYESPEQLMADFGNIAIQLYVESGRRDQFAILMRRDGTVNAFESQVRRKDGGIIWISESARSVYDLRGRLLYYEGAVVDISERKREHDELEARVRERTEALAAANAAKSHFLASMSHEIRTPMNAILGYAQILHRDPTLRNGQREAMATIVGSGNHLLGLIDEILDLSRIEAGRIELHQVNFDLNMMVADLSRMFRQRCEQKGLRLQINSPNGSSSIVRGDEKKIRQILINLLGNAVRFTDSGVVTLSIGRESKTMCRFEVLDTGIGIPREAISNIFEPFQQAFGGAGRGGSGLGLTIARQHVRLMGGELHVESKSGEGARFFFSLSLPASEDSGIREIRNDKQVDHLAAGQRVRAVIVDDVRENRQVLAEMLSMVGCEVQSFESGTAMVEYFSCESVPWPDIFFIDILMPDMDGIETARQFRTLPHANGARLVATSAAAFEHEKDLYARSGFHEILTKPISCERLYELLIILLGAEFEYLNDSDASTGDIKRYVMDLAVEEIAVLSIEIISRLRDAAELCGVTELRKCALELESATPAAANVAQCIRSCLHLYDTSPILHLLDVATAPAISDEAISV